MMRNKRTKRGFTLIELMIVVAIIGLLAAIAIPSFQNYQFTAKRSEAFANLSGLMKAEKAFYNEFGQYVGVPIAEPGNTQGTTPGGAKRSVAELEVAFGAVGWSPDGDVFYDYDAVASNVSNGVAAAHPGCSCPTCLTLTAYGNVDNDGGGGMVVFFQADDLGNVCNTGLFNHPPPVDLNGDAVLNTVIAYPVTPGIDDF